MSRLAHFRVTAPALFLAFVAAGIAAGIFSPAAAAQNASDSASQQLRSLAVYEYTGGYRKPTRSRLVPVAIWDGTGFQPGSLYLTDPEPLAVESGTLYELMQSGTGIGQVEVMQSEQLATAQLTTSTWIGLGKYLPNPPSGPQLNIPASLTARAEFASDTPRFAYRPPASTGVAEGYKANRSRPHLTHSHAAPSPAIKLTLHPLIGLPPHMQQIAAISDSAGFSESAVSRRSYVWQWTAPGDRLAAQRKLEALALQLLTASKPSLAAPLSLVKEHFRAFQLSWGSGPVYVFSARTRVPGEATTYITLIAKPDFIGGLALLFDSITPAHLLDHQPRMRLIDAVDATGSGHADLLFDLLTRHSRQFALFRVEGLHAQEVFHTGQE